MLGFLTAHIPWNAIGNLDLRQSYKALRNDLVLLSITTLSNICQSDYALTADAIKKQLPARNKVSSVLNVWTLMTKLAITLNGDDLQCELKLGILSCITRL
jgi:hypothetical protein